MGRITIIIPTSPIPSHPSHKIIYETLTSVLEHLPDAPVIITCDGPKGGDPNPSYEQYVQSLNSLVGPNDTIIACDEHIHQSGMLLKALPLVKTPLILYLEHDWKLGHPIEWKALEAIILEGEANYIKFYQGNRIHPLHEHMMGERVIRCGEPLIRTVQFSANPHLASTAWYRKLVPFFTGKVDYIENLLHGPIAVAPWETYKLAIYNPVHGDMKRSFHLDGAHTP